MPDTVHHVMWYTVYDDKTDEIIASGTADMIVQQMGYASRNSFFSAVCHAKHKKDNPRRRYIYHVEKIPREDINEKEGTE